MTVSYRASEKSRKLTDFIDEENKEGGV